jgi:hypothetical protein
MASVVINNGILVIFGFILLIKIHLMLSPGIFAALDISVEIGRASCRERV